MIYIFFTFCLLEHSLIWFIITISRCSLQCCDIKRSISCYIYYMTWTERFLRPLWPLYIVIMRPTASVRQVIIKSYMCKGFWVCVSEYSSAILGQLLLKACARIYANESQIPWDFQGLMTSSSSPADEMPDSLLCSSSALSIIHTRTHKIILICKFYSVCVNGKMKTVELIKGH